MVNAPTGVKPQFGTFKAGTDAILVFAKNKAEADRQGAGLVDAANSDPIARIAYPRAGQLDADPHRDLLWKRLDGKGIRLVRNAAIDDT